MPGARNALRSTPPPRNGCFVRRGSCFPGPTAFKVPFATADVLALLLLAWMFRREPDRNFRVAVYAWNPLVIVEFAGSGHNDALADFGDRVRAALVEELQSAGECADSARRDGQSVPALLHPGGIRKAGWPEKRAGWWGRGGGRAGRCLRCSRPYWDALGMFHANMTYYEATWKNYHASLYTVIDWLAGEGKNRAARRNRRCWGLSLWLAWKRAEPARAAYLLIGTILASPAK